MFEGGSRGGAIGSAPLVLRGGVWQRVTNQKEASIMANTGQSAPVAGVTTCNTVKVAAIVAFIPSFFSMLPQNIALLICAGMVTCAAITAAVPAPAHNRVLVVLYQIVRVTGLGVRYAVPYMATHLVKPSPAPSSTFAGVPTTTPADISSSASTGTGADAGSMAPAQSATGHAAQSHGAD